MLRLVAKTEVTDAISVELFVTQHGYAVRYGLEVTSNLPLYAARWKFHNCVTHALACAGHVSADEKGEE